MWQIAGRYSAATAQRRRRYGPFNESLVHVESGRFIVAAGAVQGFADELLNARPRTWRPCGLLEPFAAELGNDAPTLAIPFGFKIANRLIGTSV
jgi:hypothetical protein